MTFAKVNIPKQKEQTSENEWVGIVFYLDSAATRYRFLLNAGGETLNFTFCEAEYFIANKTGYWLELLHKTNYLDDATYKSLDADCTSIRVMLI